jgi:hypothetical protein
MKTLQEQYILIKEGKGNKDHFLKQAKNLFPEYINQYSDYNTTVKVLKSKSILSEGIGGVISHKPSPSWLEIFRENTSNEAVDMTSASDGPFGQAVGMIKRNGGAKLLNDKNITRAIDLFNALKSGELKKEDLDIITMADGKKFTETEIFTQDIKPLLNTNEEADVLGTPMSDLSFGSKVKVGDKAMIGDDKVTITLVDRVNGKIKQIKGKTEDGRELFVTKPMLLRPVKEETLSEVIGVPNRKLYGDYDEFAKPTKQVKRDLADQFDNEDKKNIDNVYGTSFLNGYYAEMKDPKNKTKTVDEIKQIVLKNMVKDINYYAKNAMFGTKGVGFKTEKLAIAPKGKYKSSGYGDLDKKKK